MANDRHQQPQKSYRQKGRAAKAASKVGSSSLIGGRDFVAPPPSPVVTLVSPFPDTINSSIPSSDSNESTAQTLEELDALVTSLSSNVAESATDIADRAESKAESSRESSHAWSLAIDSKINELIDRSKTFERERLEIESLREHLKQAIETAESRLVSSGSNAGLARLQELESQLIATQQENAKVSTMLLHARAEYQSLLAFIESEAADAGHSKAQRTIIAQRVLEKTDARELELSLEVSQLNDQLQFLKSELDDAKSAPINRSGDESELRLQIEQLRSQLLEARNEAIELRIHSNDLGSRLEKQGPIGHKSETLTWEQRKEALLQQLEAENHSDTLRDPNKAIEVEQILERTSTEIQRRDEEIADLKALIEQQSIARNGISIGVSAIAEMIESDALIVAERLRLKELRDEWEQKQRQAEIEMSMERAKLARERLEIQEKTQQYSDNNPVQTEEEKKSGKMRTRGRWLARLGLRDE